MKIGDRVWIYPYYYYWSGNWAEPLRYVWTGWRAIGRIGFLENGCAGVFFDYDDESELPPFLPHVGPAWMVGETFSYFSYGIERGPEMKSCAILLRIQQGITSALIVSPRRRLMHAEAEKPKQTASQICQFLRRKHLIRLSRRLSHEVIRTSEPGMTMAYICSFDTSRPRRRPTEGHTKIGSRPRFSTGF